MIGAIAAAALGVTQVYVCEAKFEGAAFLTQDQSVMTAKGGFKAVTSSFKMSVSDMEIRLIEVENEPASKDLIPFSKFNSESGTQFYSPNSSFFRRGNAGPEVISFVPDDNGGAKLMAASPISMTIGGGQHASGGKEVPAIQLVKASCLLEKGTQ